jgi:hypothetical protein
MNVSYPDSVHSDKGKIYVVYDRERFSEREILMATFLEKDILAGKVVTEDAKFHMVVNRASTPRETVLPPVLKGTGWRSLLTKGTIVGWHGREDKPHRWLTAADVALNRKSPRELLEGVGPPGPVLLNGPDGRTTDLITDDKFGDVELDLEFLVAAKSNSGVYLQGLYEIQILDSFGLPSLGVHDSGAIYERWIDGKGVGGSAPSKNVSRPPGEWQSFHIWFRAPRFDASGKKIADARFLRIEHNGVLIHQDVAVPGPTRAALEIPEAAENPLMLQGDHGPVAFRNIWIRPLK